MRCSVLERCSCCALLFSGAPACGEASPGPGVCSEVTQAIMGGSPAVPDGGAVLPASIGAIESPSGALLCTGTIVSPGRMLTAAHCRRSGGSGALRLRIPSTGGDAVVRAFVVHPELDVMLMEFDASAPGFDSALGLVSGQIDAEWIGRRLELAGYGTTETGATGELRFTEEPVAKIDDGEIAVDGAGESGACEGDSGGPLLVPDGATSIGDGGRATPRVAGVLSRGSASCRGIDVYTRADAIADWLADTMSCRAQ